MSERTALAVIVLALAAGALAVFFCGRWLERRWGRQDRADTN